MPPQWTFVAAVLLSIFASLSIASCDAHSPAFPLPQLNRKDKEIRNAYRKIKNEIEQALKETGPQTLSYSVAVTSSDDTLFDLHHTAKERDEHRPGMKKVDGSSAYRIGSITKTFTVLAILQLQKAGKLNLDDPVNKYLPDLEKHKTGSLPWKDITLRTLASQLSGIPRNLGMVDIADNAGSKLLGLPEIEEDHEVVCDSIWNYTKACTEDDLYGFLRKAEPLFAPKQQSTYSNVNFVLLGLVIEKISGQTYAEYFQEHILDDLNMSHTTFNTPADSVSVIPKGRVDSFESDLGIQNPTGGLFSTSDDMTNWVRYILTHYNGLSPIANWLQPHSYATGLRSFYGMPWEIFRTDEVLSYTDRPVTFVTKGGGWPGYTSLIVVVPEYGLGFVALVGSSALFDEFPARIAGIVGQHIVEAADAIAQRQVSKQHVGTFAAASSLNINSSITISHSKEKGLHITSWTSDSIDVLVGYQRVSFDPDTPMRLQLVPTLLFKDEKHQAGEIWRILPVMGQNPNKKPNPGPLNVGHCITDIDTMAYRTLPLNEVVFWSQGSDGVYDEIELTAWRIRLDRTSAGAGNIASKIAQTVNRGQEVLQNWFQNVHVD